MHACARLTHLGPRDAVGLGSRLGSRQRRLLLLLQPLQLCLSRCRLGALLLVRVLLGRRLALGALAGGAPVCVLRICARTRVSCAAGALGACVPALRRRSTHPWPPCASARPWPLPYAPWRPPPGRASASKRVSTRGATSSPHAQVRAAEPGAPFRSPAYSAWPPAGARDAAAVLLVQEQRLLRRRREPGAVLQTMEGAVRRPGGRVASCLLLSGFLAQCRVLCQPSIGPMSVDWREDSRRSSPAEQRRRLPCSSLSHHSTQQQYVHCDRHLHQSDSSSSSMKKRQHTGEGGAPQKKNKGQWQAAVSQGPAVRACRRRRAAAGGGRAHALLLARTHAHTARIHARMRAGKGHGR